MKEHHPHRVSSEIYAAHTGEHEQTVVQRFHSFMNAELLNMISERIIQRHYLLCHLVKAGAAAEAQSSTLPVFNILITNKESWNRPRLLKAVAHIRSS